MNRPLPSKIPKFKNDEEIAAFMEQYSAFDLVDVGLADIMPTPLFVRAKDEKRVWLIKLGANEKVSNEAKKVNGEQRRFGG